MASSTRGGRAAAASAGTIQLQTRGTVTHRRVFVDATKTAKTLTNMHDAIEATVQAVNILIDSNKGVLTRDNTAFTMDIDDTVLFVTEPGDAKHPCSKRVNTLRSMMKRLFEACQRFGRVYLVTAREGSERVGAWTREELHNAGFSGWERIFYCPRKMRKSWDTIARFKRNARRAIERTYGHRIVLTVGDKWSDHLAHADTVHMDRADASKPLFTLLTVTDPSQHTVLALKLPSR